VKIPRTGHRILAVTSGARVPAIPDVPSFGELWQQSFMVWIGLVLPKGVTPSAYVRTASAVSVLLSEPRHADSMRAAGLTFMGLSGSGTRVYVEAEFLRNAKLIAKLNDEGLRR
jgi:tripartite-type tricarboxylate transporter receptor subunit TctC